MLDHLDNDDIIDGHDYKTQTDRGLMLLSLTSDTLSTEPIETRSPDQLYCNIMQPLQFGTV